MHEVLSEALTSAQVKISIVRDLVAIMERSFKFFKTSFMQLIDRVLVIEEKDQMIKNIYTLFSKFFGELGRGQASQCKAESL